jgi:hypothetical protein
VTASALPDAWAVFCGLSDVIALLEGLPVTVDAMPEGTISLNTTAPEDFGKVHHENLFLSISITTAFFRNIHYND